MKGGWVYMLADRYRGAIYTEGTAQLPTRAWQHKHGTGSKFTARYGITRLVYAEHHDRIEDAISREKAIKKWRRAWKSELIEKDNPDWHDLFDTLNA